MPRTLPITWHPDAIRGAVQQLLTVLQEDKPGPDTLGLLNNQWIAGMHWWCLIDLCGQVLTDLDEPEPAPPTPVVDTDLRKRIGTAIHDAVCDCLDKGFGYTLRSRDLDAIEDAAMSVVAPVLAERDAEIDRLQLDIQRYQMGGGYERGHEHGSAEAAKLRLAYDGAMLKVRAWEKNNATIAEINKEIAAERDVARNVCAHLVLNVNGHWPGWGDEDAVDEALAAIPGIRALREELGAVRAERDEALAELADIHGDDAPSRIDLAAETVRLSADLTELYTNASKTVRRMARRTNEIRRDGRHWYMQWYNFSQFVHYAPDEMLQSYRQTVRASVFGREPLPDPEKWWPQPDTEATTESAERAAVSRRVAFVDDAGREQAFTVDQIVDAVEHGDKGPAIPTEPRTRLASEEWCGKCDHWVSGTHWHCGECGLVSGMMGHGGHCPKPVAEQAAPRYDVEIDIRDHVLTGSVIAENPEYESTAFVMAHDVRTIIREWCKANGIPVDTEATEQPHAHTVDCEHKRVPVAEDADVCDDCGDYDSGTKYCPERCSTPDWVVADGPATPTEPRVWRKGDPEPPEGIQVLVDCKDDHLPFLCRIPGSRGWWQWFDKPTDRHRAPGGMPWADVTAVMGSGAKDYVVALPGMTDPT